MKKRSFIKEIFLFAIVLAMLLVANVGAASDGDVFYYINPQYRSILTEKDLNRPDSQSKEKTDPAYDSGAENVLQLVGSPGTPVFQDASEAGKFIRNKMKERVQQVEIGYTGSIGGLDQWITDVCDVFFKHTGVPVEGDYLSFQVAGYSYATTYTATGPTTCEATITFAFTFWTTKEQESQVTTSVNNVINSLNLSGKSEYEKINAIYRYICEHVSYDYTNLNNDDYKLKYTAYAALINRTAVCQGYAALLYRLLLEAGVDCRIISGFGHGEPHAWNIARIGSLYYNLDVTWDSGQSVYYWFLKGNNSDDFSEHEPDNAFRTASFSTKYPMSEDNYYADDQQEMSAVFVPIDIFIKDINGKSYSTRDFSTESTVLIFGRSSCVNSTSMLKRADTVAKKYNLSTKVVFLGIDSVDSGISGLASAYPDVIFVPASDTNNQLMWTLLGYCDCKDSSLLLPATFILNRHHNVAYYTTGYNVTALANTMHYGVMNIPITLNEGIYSVRLDSAAYSYNGTEVKPDVTVIADSFGGFVLKEGRDYSLSFQNNNMAGTGKVTVIGKNGFCATLTQTFTITNAEKTPTPISTVTPAPVAKLPVPRKLTVKAGKKQATISWKKVNKATGYQIRYSLKKNMKSAKKITIKKAKTVKQIIKKLKSKKIYYIQIRAYKKVGRKTYYSAWSGKKIVKVK